MAENEASRGIGSFVALGDSFTEGLNDIGPDGRYVGWADRLAAALAARTPGFRYANLAVRGKLVRDVVDQQIGPAIAMRPDLVSIAAGGNDILRGANVDRLAELFAEGVARLRAAGCRVMIFTGFDPRVLPVIRLLRGRIATYNMHLRAIADESGCDVVDLWSMRALHDPSAWSVDRLHLVAAGHQLVALRAGAALGLEPAGDWPVPVTAPAAGPARHTARHTAWLTARYQDARWARTYAMPWLSRRLRRISSGDGLPPKRPELLPVT